MTNHGWLVRAGRGNELIEAFVEKSMVAIGWDELGKLENANSREEIKSRYRTAYPERKVGRLRVDSGTLFRFVNEIGQNDLVMTYDKSAREYHIGRVDGPYQHVTSDDFPDHPHRRPVEWVKTVSRDQFSTSAKNTLGSTLSVFSVDNCLEEIEAILEGNEVNEEIDEQDAPPYVDEVESNSQELISDIVTQIDPYDFEELVAAVLRAMGYAAKTTSGGSDYGVDVVAHPDELGFENPVIKVQVKRTTSATGNGDIGRFLGTLNPDEKGLYVSTGGYTRNARQEAQRSSRRITLVDREEFIELLLENYEDLEQEYKTYVPLKSVYVPTESATPE